MADSELTNLTALTVDLLSAYFANNTVDSAALSGLIKSTHEALKGIDAPASEAPSEQEFTPAVSVRKSLASKDQIISLIDGKAYKTLTRHLKTHGLTPAEYRQRYKLPHDYPMVAPGYSEARREVAARLGLGRKPAAKASAPAPAPTPAPTEAAQPEAASEVAPAKAPSKEKTAPRAAAKPAAKKSAAAKKEPAKAKAALVVAELTETAPAPAKDASPKKAGRTAKAAPATGATETKAATKRTPRKPKAPSEPSPG